MYSLKVILLLNCVSQGDLNSKRMSLNFFKVSQSLCSSPLYSILLPPIFPLQVECASFICPIGRDIFPRSLLGNTKSLKYMLLWYFAILTFSQTLLYGFSFRTLINSARSMLCKVGSFVLWFVRTWKNNLGTEQ